MGGVLFGLSRQAATELSFFLAIPTMLAATVLDVYKARDILSLDDVPVFVVTEQARTSSTMQGGTTVHFGTEGIHAASQQATAASNGQDVRLGGGVNTIRQYLQAGLVDEMHITIAPIMLGSGEHLLAGIDTVALGYKCTEHVTTPNATHFVLTKG